jgi:hypothetical protein
MKSKPLIFLFSQFNFPAMNYLFKLPLWAAVLMMGLYGVSCQKTDTANPIITVSGKVLEYGTKKPVPNATVYLINYKGEIFGPETYTIIDSIKTDAAGKYSFKTTNGDYMKVDKTGYFKMYTNDYTEILKYAGKKGDPITQDIVIDPIGWLKIRVKNVKPEADNDFIEFYNFSCTPNTITGKLIDETTLCPYKGNRKNIFIYSVTKHGISTRFQDSIYIKGLDTTAYSINY